jgi:hypothetical protein
MPRLAICGGKGSSVFMNSIDARLRAFNDDQNN